MNNSLKCTQLRLTEKVYCKTTNLIKLVFTIFPMIYIIHVIKAHGNINKKNKKNYYLQNNNIIVK